LLPNPLKWRRSKEIKHQQAVNTIHTQGNIFQSYELRVHLCYRYQVLEISTLIEASFPFSTDSIDLYKQKNINING
jgi:hypothetical protein